MDKKLLDLIFDITISIFENSWFKFQDRETVQDWVRSQLAYMGIFTIPCGMGWAIEVSKKTYEEYMNRLYVYDSKNFKIIRKRRIF